MYNCSRYFYAAYAVFLIINPITALTATSDVLVAFDFDNPSGAYDPSPDFVAAGLTVSAWMVDRGTLSNFGGNPGKAIATRSFIDGNRLFINITTDPGMSLTLNRLRFDVLASASGPRNWTSRVNNVDVASGVVLDSFTSVDQELTTITGLEFLSFEIGGTGATSNSGTLRIDNVELLGAVSSVPLPTALMLFSPALGLLLSRRRH